MFMTGDRPPEGWTVANGRLEEVSTVAGYAARRCEVHGRCLRRDCRRSCHFDYEVLLKAGMGALTAAKVMETFQCSRLDGCCIEFHEKPQRVITLRHVAGRDYVGVEIRCPNCKLIRLTTVEGLIHKLKKAGTGNGETSVKNVGALIRGECRACRGRRWEVNFLWCAPNAHPVPFWKQSLQKKIDEAQRRRDLARGLMA